MPASGLAHLIDQRGPDNRASAAHQVPTTLGISVGEEGAEERTAGLGVMDVEQFDRLGGVLRASRSRQRLAALLDVVMVRPPGRCWSGRGRGRESEPPLWMRAWAPGLCAYLAWGESLIPLQLAHAEEPDALVDFQRLAGVLAPQHAQGPACLNQGADRAGLAVGNAVLSRAWMQ